MAFEPKQLKCCDCDIAFEFSAGEQEFFAARNLVNDPKRCASCRLLMRFNRSGRDARNLTEVACAECNALTRVPFKPKGYRPVYCYVCLAAKKTPGDRQYDRTIEAVLVS